MAALSRLGALAAWLLLGHPAPGAAQDEASRLVDEARRLYAELDFAGAIEAAQRALETPGLTDAVRASALETLASALVVLDRGAAAQEAFSALFRLDPYWAVRERSPRVQRFAESVRSSIVHDAALDPDVVLRLDVPRTARTGRAIAVRVAVDGGDAARVRLHVRDEGEIAWTQVEARRQSATEFAVEIPARNQPEEIELYAEARDAQDRVIARSGGPLVPRRLAVRASGEERSAAEDPWLWVAIGAGAVAIGIAVAIGVAVSGPERAPAGTLPPGRVELPLLAF